VTRVVVVGAGVGGLTTAAWLARAGLDVTVLESHVYPGGCAGTFYHRGYRFDAGATLAGGFAPGGPMDRLGRALGVTWPARPAEPAMVVHLPGERTVTRWGDAGRWQSERQAHFGLAAERFWGWQERTADALWSLARRAPPWPPSGPAEAALLARTLLQARPSPLLALDALRTVAARLPQASSDLRLFVDAQLLIAAQATSGDTNALYGAAALDLPRRGVVHVAGGMGAVAQTLTEAVRRAGGRVQFRQRVTRVQVAAGRPVAVETARGLAVPADVVVLNLPPRNAADLLAEAAPAQFQHLPPYPEDGWGAFVLHVGLDARVVPDDLPLHHQVIMGEPLAEGNSIFVSLSPAWDETRAPAGRRAMTVSTHTRPAPWWDLLRRDRPAYDARRARYVEQMLRAVETVLPGVEAAADLVLPGTPATFERYTRRVGGWVGGLPQTSLFRHRSPRLGSGLWLVGDSIFPGQSVTAVALGGTGVARAILRDLPDGSPLTDARAGRGGTT
jgi:C-3',4' desaturase CrtD